VIFPRENTLVIPAINGGQGLIPVNNPARKGAALVNFTVLHRDCSLSESLKPFIPQKTSRHAINSPETKSITFECASCIPTIEARSAMAR
jgi:hypothetical protein